MSKTCIAVKTNIALWGVVLLLSPALPVFAEQASTPVVTAAAPTSSPTRGSDAVLRVSDRVKLSFYERLDQDEERWRSAGGRAVEVPREFHDRAELSGEYVIQDDGTISLPLLGRFKAAGASPEALIASLQAPFEQLIGRKGQVAVLNVVRRPIYIVGPVKTPGAYPFEPGLTPLHAVALAGGLRQDAVENWQQVETGRQMEQLAKSLERVKRYVVRTFVLKVERDGEKAEVPKLESLVGAQDLSSLSADEKAQRQLVDVTHNLELSALRSAVDMAKAELKSRQERVQPYEEQVKLLTDRMHSMQQLADKNLIGKPLLIQAQSALSDVQDRQNQAVLETEAAKDKVAKTTQELLKAETEAKIEIAKAVSAAEKDASDAVSDTSGDLNVIRTLMNSRKSPADMDAVEYDIVRRGADGTTVTFKAADVASLEPGDLIRIRMKNNGDQPVLADQ